MLLDDLVTAIQTVQQRIHEHGASLSQNEYRTRISLIDPVLNALGWDVSDPALVTIEDHHSGIGTPDYALLVKDDEDKDPEPRAYIEAKKLGEMAGTTKLAHRSQLRDYADELKTNYAGLTDGDHWIFRDFSSGFSGESYILDVTLSNQSAHQCALKMLVLWRPNLGTGQPIEANQPIIVTAVEDDPSVEKPVDSPPAAPSGENWISLSDFSPEPGKPPPRMWLPDTGEVQPNHWYGIFIHTAEWLVRTGQLNVDNCPVPGVIPGLTIISSDGRHENGKALFFPYKLSNELFLNRFGSGKTMARNSRILLKHCGQDPASILLKPSQ